MRNSKLKQFVFAAFAIAALTGGAAFGQIRVIAQVDTSQDIYVGESFTYRILIDGHDRAAIAEVCAPGTEGERSAIDVAEHNAVGRAVD